MPREIQFLALLLPLGVALLLLAGVLAWLKRWWRRRGCHKLAQRLGLRYIGRDDRVVKRHPLLNVLRLGKDGVAKNLLRGEYEGHPVEIFDFKPRLLLTGAQDSETAEQSVLVLEHGGRFPELHIYPEGAASKAAQALGYSDIDFDSVEFPDAFCVRSADRQFAYAVCHTRMMDYLLRHRDLSIEIEGDCVALSFPRRLSIEEIPGRLQQLVEIRNLLPAYLFDATPEEQR